MFTLDAKTKQSFREHREESERLGMSREEMDALYKKAKDIMVRVDDHIEALVPVCQEFPFLEALLVDVIGAARNQMSYGYRLIINKPIEEDDLSRFKQDREQFLLLIKKSFSEKKKGMVH